MDLAGRSQVVDPDGWLLVDAGHREGLVTADFDFRRFRDIARNQGAPIRAAYHHGPSVDLYQLPSLHAGDPV